MISIAPKTKTRAPKESRVLDTELGTIYIHEQLIIMEAKQDVNISIKTGLFILLEVVKIVGTKPVVYISNRIHSYSVNPNDYKYLDMIPNLKGIAIVSYSEHGNKIAAFEEAFIHKPFKVFDNLLDARDWGMRLLERHFNG